MPNKKGKRVEIVDHSLPRSTTFAELHVGATFEEEGYIYVVINPVVPCHAPPGYESRNAYRFCDGCFFYMDLDTEVRVVEAVLTVTSS